MSTLILDALDQQPERPDNLSEAHWRMLVEESGISPAAVIARGYWTATTKQQLRDLGFGESQRNVPALVIPIHSALGETVGCQIRLDVPRLDPKGTKALKYETPRGAVNRVDVPPIARGAVRDPRAPLWITEGAKKADAAASRGLACVSISGVYNWRGANDRGGQTALADWEDVALKGRLVYLAFDSDSRTNANVATALTRFGAFLAGRGATVRYVWIPTHDGRKVGLDDWFQGGGDVQALIAAATDSVPRAPRPESQAKRDFNLTDLGNAERLIAAYGDQIRYCHAWRRWLVWNGRCWDADEAGGAPVYTMLTEVIRGLAKEADDETDDDRRKEILAHAMRSESRRSLENAIELAARQPGVAVTPDQLDVDDHLINVANGTIDTRTWELNDHRQSDLLTKCIDIVFDPEAECDRWEQFLREVFQGNENLIAYMQRVIGRSLIGVHNEKSFQYLYGPGGDNGKSVLVRTWMTLVGPYGATVPTASLVAKKHDGGIPNDLASLKGSRLVVASELGEGKRLDEELIRNMTGGDMITARFMRGEFFKFMPKFQIVMTGNYLPRIKGTDQATWKRVRVVPFNRVFAKDEQDPHLDEKLRGEMVGILAWALEGTRDYLEEGMGTPDEVSAAVKAYRDDMDEVGKFLADCTRSGEGEQVSAQRLYSAYTSWATANGERPMTGNAFGRRMEGRGALRVHTKTGKVYRGLGLLADDELAAVYRGGE